nr:hypothetical protein [Methylomarinum sp. Ch1-1]MDP4522424.1 hypothetical protein [Methylomarinum sp. Ch1-1]
MKRIKNRCAPNVGRLRVGWLREASHHNPHRGPNLALCVSKADCLAANPPYGGHPTVAI